MTSRLVGALGREGALQQLRRLEGTLLDDINDLDLAVDGRDFAAISRALEDYAARPVAFDAVLRDSARPLREAVNRIRDMSVQARMRAGEAPERAVLARADRFRRRLISTYERIIRARQRVQRGR